MISSDRSSRRKSDAGDGNGKHFDPVLVYCRVRPLPLPTDLSNVEIKNSTTVVLRAPKNLSTQKPYLEQETHYEFKQVFGPTSTQSEIYQVVAQPLVEKLIRGSNSLLFTYGVTGSGKTYTMTGDPKELGLMPRCLEALFRSIGGFHARKFIFQPDHLNGFEIISDVEATAKQKIEKHQRLILGQRAVVRSKPNETEYELSAFEHVVALPGVDERNVYAVFISYTEVYNNCVYDLLEECSVQRGLQSRIVREDSNHNMYVHGVTELEIKSVQEAMEAFQIGQKNKKIGHTLLNAESSRSHSVFNIRLVQAPIGQHARMNKHVITVSQLSLVDLAGSERSSRTNNSGTRLRETGNINNSLMTLRNCLEYLRENQQAMSGNMLKKIPYRDSKITQLFKNFFEGEGQVSMIACINPRLEDFNENSQVMRFSETTQEVQVPRATTVQLSSNEDEIVNLLRTKFIGYELEVPCGDGHLSEKLIFMFKQYLEKSKKDSNMLEVQCENYRQKISELEQLHLELKAELCEERMLHKKVCERNRQLEKVVNSYKDSLTALKEQAKDLEIRLDIVEEKISKVSTPTELCESTQPISTDSNSTNEELQSTSEMPATINTEFIKTILELFERNEIT